MEDKLTLTKNIRELRLKAQSCHEHHIREKIMVELNAEKAKLAKLEKDSTPKKEKIK